MNDEEQLRTELDNRTEHKEDQRDYQRDRLADKTIRVEKAAELEGARVEAAAVIETARAVKASELEAVAREKAKAHRRIAYAQLAAYLLILLVSVVGWQEFQQRDEAICKASEDNREALTNVIRGTEQLGTRLVLGGEAGTITPQQQRALDEFAAFRVEQLALLDGAVCE